MKSGEIIYTTNLEVMPPGTRSAFYFNANKEDTFVLIFLGVEPRDGSAPLDVVHALNDLGWKLQSEFKGAFKEKDDE